MTNSRKANLFIVGAPKCGTTALNTYLNEHPQVFMSPKKEIHFFATDLPGYRECKTEDEYSLFFENASDKHKIIGDASVYYLYSQTAIENIYKYNRDGKLIVMLRNPAEMVYSLHSQMIWSANEDVLDFEEAWNLSVKRKKGINLPKHYTDEKILFYDEIAKYGDQLERLYKVFPKENVKVIVFDDFKRNIKEVYQDVLSFLSLPAENRETFEKINENALPISIWFNQLMIDQPRLIRRFKEGIKSLFGIKDFGVTRRIKIINSKNVERKQLKPEMTEKIIQNYKNDIKKLSLIINHDLSHWYTQ